MRVVGAPDNIASAHKLERCIDRPLALLGDEITIAANVVARLGRKPRQRSQGLEFCIEAIHQVGGKTTPGLNADDLEVRVAFEQLIRNGARNGGDQLAGTAETETEDGARRGGVPRAERRDRAIETNYDVKAGWYPGGLAERPQRIEMTVCGAPSVNHLRRDEEPAEPPLNTALELACRFLHISPVDHCYREQTFAISLAEIVDPVVVSPTVRVREIKIVGRKRKNADRRKDDGLGDAPLIHSSQPGVPVEAIVRIVSSV